MNFTNSTNINYTNSTNINYTKDYGSIFIYGIMGIIVCYGIFLCIRNEYNDYKYGIQKGTEV